MPRNKILLLVAHFSLQSQQLNSCLKANFQKFHKPITAYRRNTNLLDGLVQSKIYNNPPKGRIGCCKYYTPAQLVVSRFSRKVFQLPRALSHETCNCVYFVFYTLCSTLCRTNKERAKSANIPTRTQYYSKLKKGDMLYNTFYYTVYSRYKPIQFGL